MSRRRLLTDELWARHYEPPEDEREIARHYTLGPDEMEQVTAKRGDANRLGCALVLLYLRYPGRTLDSGERPPPRCSPMQPDSSGLALAPSMTMRAAMPHAVLIWPRPCAPAAIQRSIGPQRVRLSIF